MSATPPSSQICTLPTIPELFDPNFLDVLLSVADNRRQHHPKEHRSDWPASEYSEELGVTVNSDATSFHLPDSAILDAFSGLSARSSNSLRRLDTLLQNSWLESPEETLKIIWHTRSIRDGKGEKELFYRAFGWLYEHHPYTAICNLSMIVAPVCVASKDKLVPHGYWKDLLNILALATCDELSDFHSRPSNVLRTYTPKNPSPKLASKNQLSLEGQTRNLRTEKQYRNHRRLVEKLAVAKYRALYIRVARLFAERLRKDIQLLDQLQSLNPNSERNQYLALRRDISLAGKWGPTPGGSHDRITNISTAICQLLFSPNENAGPGAIGPLPSAAPHPISADSNNCTIYRSYYQRWVLKPLREALACPEPLMSASRWKEIRYSCVPSICMARNRAHFIRHDPEGYELYLAGAQSRKKSASDIPLMPHELVAKAIELQRACDLAQEEQSPRVAQFKQMLTEKQIKVVDAQWRALISRLKEDGGFEDTLAVYGISEAMGLPPEYDKNNVHPMFPSVALSLTLASITKPPFDAGFVAYLEHLTFARLQGLEEKGLIDLVNDILAIESGGSIGLRDVLLRVVLPLAKEHNVAREDMIKRVVVFSDMQFDHVAGIITGPWWLNRTSESEKVDRWQKSYDSIEQAFRKAGYEVPEIVFWELGNESSVRQMMESEAERRGVTMISGFSTEMMKTFLGDEAEENWLGVTEDGDVFEVEEVEEEITPLDVMKIALDKRSYDGLVVLD